MAQPGFIIEKRFNAPRVPWKVESAVFGTFLEATETAVAWKYNNPDFRFRLLFQSRYGGQSVVIPPETFDLNLGVMKQEAERRANA